MTIADKSVRFFKQKHHPKDGFLLSPSLSVCLSAVQMHNIYTVRWYLSQHFILQKLHDHEHLIRKI